VLQTVYSQSSSLYTKDFIEIVFFFAKDAFCSQSSSLYTKDFIEIVFFFAKDAFCSQSSSLCA